MGDGEMGRWVERGKRGERGKKILNSIRCQTPSVAKLQTPNS
jgi:hypothetical protein